MSFALPSKAFTSFIFLGNKEPAGEEDLVTITGEASAFLFEDLGMGFFFVTDIIQN
jgi:hypothetical protein